MKKLFRETVMTNMCIGKGMCVTFCAFLPDRLFAFEKDFVPQK